MAKNRLRIEQYWDATDSRDVPTYSISEAAHYLCMPKQTVRAWVLGTKYGLRGEQKDFPPVIETPSNSQGLLSFYNLIEVHALRALRTKYAIRLQAIRTALDYVKVNFSWQRPLIQQQFQTDGVNLFVEELGKLIDVSNDGQEVMRAVMIHLERVEFENQLAIRLYPFTRPGNAAAPKSILIDPRYSFGRPILSATKTPIAALVDRYKAGESMQGLADDYGLNLSDVEEGIRCEIHFQNAA